MAERISITALRPQSGCLADSPVASQAGTPTAVVVVRDTVWNKYRNQRRELTALWREIHKRAAMLAAARAVAKAP